jgi:hypothetical protein
MFIWAVYLISGDLAGLHLKTDQVTICQSEINGTSFERDGQINDVKL